MRQSPLISSATPTEQNSDFFNGVIMKCAHFCPMSVGEGGRDVMLWEKSLRGEEQRSGYNEWATR